MCARARRSRTCPICSRSRRSCSRAAATRTRRSRRCSTTRSRTAAGSPAPRTSAVDFGRRVARIVLACSDSNAVDPSQKRPWRERKEHYLAQLPHKEPDELRVSLADKVHNARAILLDLDSGIPTSAIASTPGPQEQLWYYRSLAEALRDPCGGPARGRARPARRSDRGARGCGRDEGEQSVRCHNGPTPENAGARAWRAPTGEAGFRPRAAETRSQCSRGVDGGARTRPAVAAHRVLRVTRLGSPGSSPARRPGTACAAQPCGRRSNIAVRATTIVDMPKTAIGPGATAPARLRARGRARPVTACLGRRAAPAVVGPEHARPGRGDARLRHVPRVGAGLARPSPPRLGGRLPRAVRKR